MRRNRASKALQLAAILITFFTAGEALAHSANKVWFERRDNGTFRVWVNYTVPALREFREVYADFAKRSEAESFYWNVVRGGDFYHASPKDVRFSKPPLQPQPW